jgi:glycogen operon protein
LVDFKLPSVSDQHWKLIIDTNIFEEEEHEEQSFAPEAIYGVTGRSFLMFELVSG